MSEDQRAVHFPEYSPTMPEMIRHLADQWSDANVVILGDRKLSFTQADVQSARLAKGLLAAGVGKGARVGLLAPNGPDWVVGWLAAARIGAIAVLCNTYHKPRELGWVLHHADVEVLLAVDRLLDHDYCDRLETLAPELVGQCAASIMVASHPYLRSVWMWGAPDRPWAGHIAALVAMGDSVSDDVLAAAEAQVVPADPVVVIYSSGSTAEPKGVVHSHGALVRHSHNLLPFKDVVAGDVIYTPMPLFWVGGLSYTLMCAMHLGATVVFEERFEPGATLDLIERERVTHVAGWPHVGKALVEHPSFPSRDLAHLRSATLSELLPPNRRVGDAELRANSLGMSETCGPHSCEAAGTVLPAEKRGSFGRSVPGVEHRIVDPVTGEVLGPREFGEIHVRGYSVAIGMLRRERSDIFTPDGWYATGDGGFLDEDGHLYFKGRMGETIKASGMNVTPREVELVIEEQPEVMYAIVMGVPDADRGEDVAAAIVLRPGQTMTSEDLRARLKGDISSYKVPALIAFFREATDLPWLESGKVDRRALRASLIERFGQPSSEL